MKKILILFLFWLTSLYCSTVHSPQQEIVVDGMAKDMVVRGNTLIIGTDSGKVQMYDYENKVFTSTITLPDVKDFIGDMMPARIFSVDEFDGRYLLLSDSGKGGYSNLWIDENNVTTQLLGPEDHSAIIKVRFINKDQVLLGFLSNEAALFDIKSKKELYRIQLSPSKFSDFALSEDKTQAVFSCESGVLNIIDTKSGKVLNVLDSVNVDNVYKVAFKQGIVSGAGQDRRGAIYDLLLNTGEYIESSFLIYATALSPSANKVAFTMNEQNDIYIYDRNTKAKIAELKGQKSTLNTIIFKDENVLFSASDDNTVMMWNLKQ